LVQIIGFHFVFQKADVAAERCISRKNGYTGYIVDNQQVKWLHNWLQFFKSGYIIDSQ